MSISDSARLRFDPFSESDIPALAELLADSSITRNITCNGATLEQCLASARHRIKWHNSSWNQQGYGVWALRRIDIKGPVREKLVGWCGFTPPDGADPEPEILYAIHQEHRGIGLAFEAASHAITWLFSATNCQGVTAVIFSALNPGSMRVADKLGMRFSGKMPFSQFLSNTDLADEVAAYELWRLAHESTLELDRLIQQTAFRVGQLSTVTSMSSQSLLNWLSSSLLQRSSSMGVESDHRNFSDQLRSEFVSGSRQAYMECYHLSKPAWLDSIHS